MQNITLKVDDDIVKKVRKIAVDKKHHSYCDGQGVSRKRGRPRRSGETGVAQKASADFRYDEQRYGSKDLVQGGSA